MTSLNGYIQGFGGKENRTVNKTGKEIKLSVYNDIDRVIVFNEAGETSQATTTGKNLLTDIGSRTITSQMTILLYYPLNAGTYTISFDADNTTSVIGYLNINIPNYQYNPLLRVNIPENTSGRYSGTFTLSENTTISILCNGQVVGYNFIVSNTMIEAGSQPTSYEEYTGGVPSPNPSYPQDIDGIGFRRPDGCYTVTISYDDGDEHYGTIIASGLAYPLYEGDVLDFVNGKVIRANGYIDLSSLSWSSGLISSNPVWYSSNLPNPKLPTNSTIFNGKAEKYIPIQYNDVATNINTVAIRDNGVLYINNNSDTIEPSGYLLYELATAVDEYITLTGDISDIETATVTADGTLTVKYDKVEMAIRKYSSPPDWSKIGYSATPNVIIDAFAYSKQIYDTWSFTKYTSDLNLRIFPNVDITGQLGLNGMFKGCSNLIALPPLTIGTDSGSLNASEFARTSGIEEVTITSNNLNQENNFQNGFNGCSFLKEYSITAKVSNVNAMFSGCSRLVEASDFDTSTTTNFSEMFSGCSSLTYVSDDFDTSSGTNFYRCFYICTSLESIPSWNLRNGTNLQQLFAGCSSIKNVPPLVITAATNLTNMFQNSGSNLTENSRNNILMMLATASSYTGTKTLAAVGFTSSMYSAASWQALTNYGDFTTAGWSIGYS